MKEEKNKRKAEEGDDGDQDDRFGNSGESPAVQVKGKLMITPREKKSG